MKRGQWCASLAVLCLILLAGCEKNEAVQADLGRETSVRETVTEADAQAAVDKVYDMLPEARYDQLTDSGFAELFPELKGTVADFYGCISNPNGGLADLIIVEPDGETGSRDKVREQLRLYQEKRIRQFENYDILDAFAIAGGAEVFDQGDYVILLMLPDNEAAREIIDQHIPL